MLTLTLIIFHLSLQLFNEVYQRNIGPPIVKTIGKTLFGTYKRSLALNEGITISWIFSGSYDLYGPTYESQTNVFIFGIFAVFIVVIVWIFQDLRFRMPRESNSVLGMRIEQLALEKSSSPTELEEFFEHLIERYEGTTTRALTEEYKSAKTRILSRNDDIEILFRQLLLKHTKEQSEAIDVE